VKPTMKTFFLVIVSGLALCSCDATPSKPSQSTAANVLANLRYVRDSRTDLCYAVMSSHRAGEVNDAKHDYHLGSL